MIEDGGGISEWLIRGSHDVLLHLGRGSGMSPGEFKQEPNYVVDRTRRKVLFVPIQPEFLQDGIDQLMGFIGDEDQQILIRTALAHVEFEALHPFKDGNGRIGRMLITLMLWKYGVISAPHFYISSYFEEHRDEYLDRMREVSRSNAWTDWVIFFLNALEAQAQENLQKAEEIQALYDEMKEIFRELLASKWSTQALDFVFTRPVFRNNIFTGKSGIPGQTAHRFTRVLAEEGLLRTVRPASGRRAAMYAFEPLLGLVRR